MSEWHRKFCNAMEFSSREVLRMDNQTKHFVDSYDSKTQRGIEFQHSNNNIGINIMTRMSL